MGHCYSNITLRDINQSEAAAALSDRVAFLSKVRGGCAVVFDGASEREFVTKVGALAARLSSELRCVALAALNHDDSILQLRLYRNGALLDPYDSAPGYFDPRALPGPPSGGDAALYAEAFGITDIARIERILHSYAPFDLTRIGDPDAEQNKYALAVERHRDLAEILGIPRFVAGLAFSAIAHGNVENYGVKRAEFFSTEVEES
jgi:hypothetical protein